MEAADVDTDDAREGGAPWGGKRRREGGGLLAGGGNRPSINPKYKRGRGAMMPPEWIETLEGITMERVGESSIRGAPEPLEWKGSPGGTKTTE